MGVQEQLSTSGPIYRTSRHRRTPSDPQVSLSPAFSSHALREGQERGEKEVYTRTHTHTHTYSLSLSLSLSLGLSLDLSRPLSTSLCICASTDLSLRLKPNEMLTSLRWMAMGSFGVSFTSSRNSYTSVGSCGWGRALHRQHNEKNTRMHSTNRAVRSTQTRHKQTKSRPPPPPSLHKADGCTPAALARWLRCHADKRRCGSR